MGSTAGAEERVKMIIVAHSLYKNDKEYVKPTKNTEVIAMD